MKFEMTPFSEQIDMGFGLMGNYFEQAAEKLEADKEGGFGKHLIPKCHLYRHSVELHLKSIIMILHRHFKIPLGKGSGKSPYPSIQDNRTSNWKALNQVHSVADLFVHFEKLIRQLGDKVKQAGKTDWSDIPNDLRSWISVIEKYDRRGTFLRYPGDPQDYGEYEKSIFKRKSPDEIARDLNGEGPKTIALVIQDDEGNATDGFVIDDEALKDLREALANSARTLLGVHLGFRHEFCDGW